MVFGFEINLKTARLQSLVRAIMPYKKTPPISGERFILLKTLSHHWSKFILFLEANALSVHTIRSPRRDAHAIRAEWVRVEI